MSASFAQSGLCDDFAAPEVAQPERRRKAGDLIAMIRELRAPPMQPPPLVYRAEEPPEDEPSNRGGIGS